MYFVAILASEASILLNHLLLAFRTPQVEHWPLLIKHDPRDVAAEFEENPLIVLTQDNLQFLALNMVIDFLNQPVVVSPLPCT